MLSYNVNSRTLIGQQTVRRAQRRLWQFVFVCATLLLGYQMTQANFITYSADGVEIGYSILVWMLYLSGVVAIFIKPRIGVYLTLPLAVAGDAVLSWWYPFDLNFSSEESLLYLHDSIIISPLESFLIFTIIAFLIPTIIGGGRNALANITFGSLFWHSVIFMGFAAVGVVYGLGRGGDSNIGLWEARAIFYIPLCVFAASNLITTRRQINTLITCIVLGVTFEGFVGTRFFIFTMRGSFAGFGDIMDHPSAIHMNAIFIYAAAIFVYRVAWPRRFFLLSVFPFIAITYLAAQRRSAFISLGIALGLLLLMVFRLYRKLFYVLAPTAAVMGVLYLGAFWNSGSPIALPAQAVKSVIATDNSSEADRLSNVYREIENININWTIRNHPLMGIGFGQKFLILIPMADISFFEWYEYITHNSVVWIWMKAGLGGFVSMLFMIGAALQIGARAMWKMPNNEMGAATAFFTLYLLMHMIFAYVDMSWSAQSMLFVGTSIGILNVIEKIMRQPVDLPETRWKWVPEPQPPLGWRED